jgi:Amt family ammonium transporter
MFAAALVFLMQAGFALLEGGMARSKNAVNVIMKNYMDTCVGGLIFWLFGFGLMFGTNITGWIGSDWFMPQSASNWDWSFILFQMMFAATACTIASGAMAERVRYSAYLIGACVITGSHLSRLRRVGVGKPCRRQRLAKRNGVY